MMLVREPLPSFVSQRMACDVFNINRNTLRRKYQQNYFCGPLQPVVRARNNGIQPRGLTVAERDQVSAVLYSESYCNQPPVQVYHDLSLSSSFDDVTTSS